MEEYITKECIISEFLNNWFTIEELAAYLCISVDDVLAALKEYSQDDKNKDKIDTHRGYIERYNREKDNPKEIEKNDYTEIAYYIIENNASIRNTASHFDIGKTTVYDYIHEKLPGISIVLYKEVFDVLVSNKSFSVNNKRVIEQVLKSYELLQDGYKIEEIGKIQGLGRNIVQRNLSTRLPKIDNEKYLHAKMILELNQKTPLKENAFGK